MTENESEKQDFRLELAQQVLGWESMQLVLLMAFSCVAYAAVLTVRTRAGLPVQDNRYSWCR
jgi:hypothetical protein